MTRLYGRAFSNERINDYVPDVRFERTSIMGAIGKSKFIAPFIFRGTLNTALFRSYVSEVLAQSLKKGDTFILDNSSVHTAKDIMKPLTDMGVNVLFLPKYSPDLNPIELAWSKMKAYLRKKKPRDTKSLTTALNNALDTITPDDINAWIAHCGYA